MDNRNGARCRQVPVGAESGRRNRRVMGQVVREVVAADKQSVEEAIESATLAFPAWRDTPPLKRARIMFKFKELLEQNTDVIVALITEEHGKVLDDAKGEFIRGVEVVEYACAAPELLKGPSTCCFQKSVLRALVA